MADHAKLAQRGEVVMACICGSEADHSALPHANEVATLMLDGNQWCASDPEGLPEGVVGYGNTPEEACAEFDKEWHANDPSYHEMSNTGVDRG